MNIYSNLFFCINKYLTFRPIFNLMVIWHFETQFFFSKDLFSPSKTLLHKMVEWKRDKSEIYIKNFLHGDGEGGGGGDWIKFLNTLYFSTVHFKCNSLTMFFKIIFFLEYSLFSYIDIHEGTDRIFMHVVSVSLFCGSTPLNLAHAWWSTLWSSVANHQWYSATSFSAFPSLRIDGWLFYLFIYL